MGLSPDGGCSCLLVASYAGASFKAIAQELVVVHARRAIFRVPGAMQRSSRCFAEPGPYQAPAFVTAPALQRTASRRATRCAASGARGRSARLQQFRADEQLDPAAPERDVVPVVDVEVDYGKARGRQIVGERAARLRLAAAGERERQFVQAGIVPDQQQ